MSQSRSPLAPEGFPEMPPIAGVGLATAGLGLRYRGRDDVLLVTLPPETSVAGVLTRSRTASAAVSWCRRALESGSARALLANAGNANAFTGRKGELGVHQCAETVARVLGCSPAEVFLASTGVIGEPLNVAPITAAAQMLHRSATPDGWLDAANAIRTTDTFPKGAFRRCQIAGKPVTLGGIAKGSGMVAPDMATVLAFVFTDATLPPSVLRSLLSREVQSTFNCITVDSDTSTSDTLLLFATQRCDHPPIEDPEDPRLEDFRAALHQVLRDLATQIVRDGEGATKFVTLEVSGAESDLSAKKIAMAVANSPLVKTAIAGEDPNWGRIVMAIGKAGEPADRDRIAIRFGELTVAAAGERSERYDEAALKAYMKQSELTLHIDAGTGGSGFARVWTCDLTHGYISINADYRS